MNTLTQTTHSVQTLLGEGQAGLHMESSIDLDIVSTLFDSALLQFLLSQNTAEQKGFESWVHEHSSTPTFLSDICAHYPHFYSILQTEILNAHL
jgi:hypothetical protein